MRMVGSADEDEQKKMFAYRQLIILYAHYEKQLEKYSIEVCLYDVVIWKCMRYNYKCHVTHICNLMTQQTPDVEPMLFECWSTICDAGPAFNQH